MADSKSKLSTKNIPSGGLKKRQQLDNTNRTMFIWVACASVVVACAIVAIIFIMKQIIFNEQILGKQSEADSNLSKNIESAKELDRTVKELKANRNIAYVQGVVRNDNNLDKIFYSLPYDNDEIAVGSSLQANLLNDVNIDSLSVGGDDATSVTSQETSAADLSDGAIAQPEIPADAQSIPVTFKVIGTEERLNKMFGKFSHSIRPLRIKTVEIKSEGGGMISANIQADMYYQFAKQFEVKQEVIKKK